MIAIVDSGSTKADWALIKSENDIQIIETVGLHPEDLTIKLFKEVCIEIKSKIKVKEIEKLYFYGAGCGSENNKEKLEDLFYRFFKKDLQIIIETDLLGVAHSILGNKKGWVAILGTGSNVGYYTGKNIIKYTTSLRYPLGDEGGAFHLATKFIYYAISKPSANEMTKDILDNFEINLRELLNSDNKKDIVTILPKIIHSLKQKYPDVRNLIIEVFEEFLNIHIIPYYNSKKEPIHFGGSIAYHFREELKEAMEKHNLKLGQIVDKPIKGLIEYYKRLP